MLTFSFHEQRTGLNLVKNIQSAVWKLKVAPFVRTWFTFKTWPWNNYANHLHCTNSLFFGVTARFCILCLLDPRSRHSFSNQAFCYRHCLFGCHTPVVTTCRNEITLLFPEPRPRKVFLFASPLSWDTAEKT